MLVRSYITILIFLALIITLCPSAHSQSGFKCGKEFRIETLDRITFQGRLLSNDGNLLTLWSSKSGMQTIALEDAASAFRVKRKTGTGILIGSLVGTGVGLMVAYFVNQNMSSSSGHGIFSRDYHSNLDDQIRTGVSITVGSVIVGCFVGGIIGYNTQKLGPVQIEALPLCLSQSGDIIPAKVNLAINF